MQSALDHYDELATKAHHWMSDIPKAIRAYYSEPNQPAPKSAEEVLKLMVDEMPFHLHDSIKPYILEAMQIYASQTARYVTDEEIDAMWPYETTLAILYRREGAKAMRDKIFWIRPNNDATAKTNSNS